MPRTILFHTDEDSSNAQVAKGLRRLGIDVTTTPEAGLIGASDQAQLVYAHAHARVLVTFDSDHLALHAAGMEHSGITIITQLRGHRRQVGEIISGLELIWEILEPFQMVNRIEYI